MKNMRIAFWANACIAVFVAFAVAWAMSGLWSGPNADSGLMIFRYFTVDSNILMGITAAAAAAAEQKVLAGERSCVPASILALKLVATAAVALTMLVTVFFLAPTKPPTDSPINLFIHSNFFLHLAVPTLSVLTFVLFEKTQSIPFRMTFAALIPMGIYSVFYMAITLLHSHNGTIAEGYDWYGFFFAGMASIAIVLPAMLLVTYGIGVALWKPNRGATR